MSKQKVCVVFCAFSIIGLFVLFCFLMTMVNPPPLPDPPEKASHPRVVTDVITTTPGMLIPNETEVTHYPLKGFRRSVSDANNDRKLERHSGVILKIIDQSGDSRIEIKLHPSEYFENGKRFGRNTFKQNFNLNKTSHIKGMDNEENNTIIKILPNNTMIFVNEKFSRPDNSEYEGCLNCGTNDEIKEIGDGSRVDINNVTLEPLNNLDTLNATMPVDDGANFSQESKQIIDFDNNNNTGIDMIVTSMSIETSDHQNGLPQEQMNSEEIKT